MPKKKLFNNDIQHDNIHNTTPNIVPLETDFEVLLINSGKIDAVKVQTLVNNFMLNKNYVTVFCLTETKVKKIELPTRRYKVDH